jgi:iron(III) transport system permease protein
MRIMTSPWRARFAAWLLALPLCLPLLLLVTSWGTPQPEVWLHLRTYLLADVVRNSVALCVLLAVLVSVLGLGLACPIDESHRTSLGAGGQ